MMLRRIVKRAVDLMLTFTKSNTIFRETTTKVTDHIAGAKAFALIKSA